MHRLLMVNIRDIDFLGEIIIFAPKMPGSGVKGKTEAENKK